MTTLPRGTAAGRFGEALSRAQSAGSRLGIVVALDIIALPALERGDVDKAALLAATAQKMRTEIGGVPSMALVGLQPIVEILAATGNAGSSG